MPLRFRLASSERFLFFLEALGVSLLVILPCVWQPHLQSADLPSRLYNAWLAHALQASPAPNLEVGGRWTNILADLLLHWTSNRDGIVRFEFLVPISAVLLFFWGAFFWLTKALGKLPRPLYLILAMLSYGVIFHAGFLNHYLSTGLALWILGLLWVPTRRSMAIAGILVVLALLAHPLPVLWAVTVLLYVWILRRIPRDVRAGLFVTAVVLLMVVGQLLVSRYPSRPVWATEGGAEMFLEMTALDQVWLFGPKYLLVAAAMMAITFTLLVSWIDSRDPKKSDVSGFHLWLLHGVAVLVIPAAIQLPQYGHVLAYIPQRISLFGALMLAFVLANAGRMRVFFLSLPPAALFFTFLFVDSRAYNQIEAQVHSLVHEVPSGVRVVGPILDPGARLQALIHVVDRACPGHCLSFANYEPASGQFRVRATGENAYVAWPMSAVQAIEEGEYQVRAQDEPIYSICTCGVEGTLCIKKIPAGAKTCSTSIKITPDWLAKD